MPQSFFLRSSIQAPGPAPVPSHNATDPAIGVPRQESENSREFNEDGARRVPNPAPLCVFLFHTSELRQHPEPGQSYVNRAERPVSAAGLVIVEMAYFAIADQKPANLCTEESHSEVYVGMFGLLYGLPVRDRQVVSYTESAAPGPSRA